jgi:hypothetical protein
MLHIEPSDRLFAGHRLKLEEVSPPLIEGKYLPSPDCFDEYNAVHGTEFGGDRTPVVIDINYLDQYIIFSPVITSPTSKHYLKAKYGRLKYIVFDCDEPIDPADSREFNNLMEQLPSGFIKNFEYGYGLKRDYHTFLQLVLGRGFTTLVVSSADRRKFNRTFFPGEKILWMTQPAFGNVGWTVRRVMRKYRQLSRKEQSLRIQNEVLHHWLPEEFPRKELNWESGSLAKLAAQRGSSAKLAITDYKAAAEVARDGVSNLAQKAPRELRNLQVEIERVSLRQFISRMEDLLKRTKIEAEWQKFFKDNPLVLNLAFNFPINIIQDRAYVGGTAVQKHGGKLADFLAKNQLSESAALIEIKTPKTRLLSSKPYRQGVFAPHGELAGAIAQVLDQRHTLVTSMPTLQYNKPELQISAHHVHCVVIAGLMPAERCARRSFELYRSGLKDVAVVTFDELLAKLSSMEKLLLAVAERQSDRSESRPWPTPPA